MWWEMNEEVETVTLDSIEDMSNLKSSHDTGRFPTCLDCFGYQYGLEGIEFLEEQGFSVIEI